MSDELDHEAGGELPGEDGQDDEWDRIEIVRAKWTMDGASTVSEAADRLRREADYLLELERDGWQLIQPVEDDYGHIANSDPTKRLSVPLGEPLPPGVDELGPGSQVPDGQGHDSDPPGIGTPSV
jgi:hypothetical protein